MANAQILAACSIPDPFVVEGVTIRILSMSHNGNDLILRIKASQNGSELLDDFIFRNPPIKVPDGTTRTIQTNNILVGEIEVENVVIDPDTALKQIVSDSVLIAWAQRA